MSRDKWQQLAAARELLGLGERATVREVKQAYRRLSKEHHPDTANPATENERVAMHELTTAYQTLLRHCEQYPIPLRREESDQPVDGEDWWMDRFGQDPLWGKGGK
jgi:hypothetical protein